MDIITLPLEIDHLKIGSRYRLVIVASQRARQLVEGQKSIIQTRYTKASSIALQEILEDTLEILHGKEAKLAQREAKRLREEMKNRQLLTQREEALASEIRKDLSIYLEESAKRREEEPVEEAEEVKETKEE
ncbi:MAG: DNA-directed RNA polymerase subunit omega [Candidatus Manganitrophaceae bacterium]